MTSERWQQVEEVLQAALDRPPEARAAFLDDVCAGDDELKIEASSLMDAYLGAGDFLEEPALARDARVLATELIDANVGRELGSYKIIERLGAGGMGEVYLAQDTRLSRLVALKILPSYWVADETRLRRFQREARAASALNHPNIITIHEVGETEGVHFIVAEFIDGKTIRELIAAGDLSLEEILDIGVQVASALEAAHMAGIVHRDIKPENIMRREDQLVKILDFGIAKLTEQPTREASSEALTALRTQTEMGVVMGTVGYMSPEQARGLVCDERTDVWSLGVVLYEMLTGRTPFAGATRLDTLVSILEREPAPIQPAKDSPAGLRQLQHVIEQALRKDRGERYQTASHMLADLRGVRQGLDLAPMRDGKMSLTFIRDAPGAQERGDESKASEPASSTSNVSGSTHLATASPQAVKRPRRAFVIMAIGVALLAVAIIGTLLYQRYAARRSADTVSAPQAATANKLYREMSEAEQYAFIEAQEQRISAMMGDRLVRLNQDALRVIKRQVDAYVTRLGSQSKEYGSGDLRLIYERAVPYIPLIARSFSARKVPVIIGIYLPMIESEYKPCYESSFGAKGIYQFLPQTARLYGVAPEEMCDAEKMTPAAAHYIADRMAELGDDSQSMTLVILSYNRGPEWVRDTLRQLRETDNYERNFWTLFANRDKLDESFRRESAGYVPLFFAAAIIGENPHNFELRLPPLSTLAGTSSASAAPER
jgi:serine/threonine protein kinase